MFIGGHPSSQAPAVAAQAATATLEVAMAAKANEPDGWISDRILTLSRKAPRTAAFHIPIKKLPLRDPYPPAVMSRIDARSRKRHGGFWRKQTFNLAAMDDRAWVGRGRFEVRARTTAVLDFQPQSCASAMSPVFAAEAHEALRLACGQRGPGAFRREGGLRQTLLRSLSAER